MLHVSYKFLVSQLSDQSEGRLARRKGTQYRDLLNMLVLLIPGAAVTYYGEEIGMEETAPSFDETQDVFGKQMGPVSYATVVAS